MQYITPVEILYALFDETATALQEELHCSYLEAIAETGENLFQNKVLQEEVSEITKRRLEKEYQKVILANYSNEEIRKSFQLAVLKGMKEATQPNHQMTPDSVALFMGYLISKLTQEQEEFSILDPAVGTGNLLTTILNQHPFKGVTSYGVEIDDILLKLAYVSANLQKHSIQFFNQDSLEPLYVDPVDLVVCDLPIGFYPNDVGATNFALKAKNGHSFAHHLFIEQSMNYTKQGGYLLFLIPNSLFQSDQASELHQYLKEQCIIQGLIQLPISMFKNEKSAKSIFILQKKGEHVKAPRQALLVDLPKFSNKTAMAGIIQRIDGWFTTEKNV